MSINRVCISGGLTRDSELRQTQGGSQILSFSVAVTDRRKDPQSGEWRDFPNYIDCALFGKRAETLARFLSKGTKVFVEGKLRWSQWERDGQKRSKIEVIVDDVEFSSRQRDSKGNSGAYNDNGGSGGPYGGYVPQSGYHGGSQVGQQQDVYADSDIPF